MNELWQKLAEALMTAVGGTLAAWFLARVQSGRLSRTFEHAKKVNEFVERFSTNFTAVAQLPEPARIEAEKLLLDNVNALRTDLAAEREILEQFQVRTATFRDALFLHLPSRPILILPFLLFHTMLLFVLYVVVYRLVYGGMRTEDGFAIGIAAFLALVIRWIARSMSRPGSVDRKWLGAETDLRPSIE
jgi:hypothetical protein